MRLSRKEHLVLDIIHLYIEMEESEEIARAVGGRENRLAMAHASDRYNDMLAKAKKRFNNTDDLYLALDAGTNFINLLRGLR